MAQVPSNLVPINITDITQSSISSAEARLVGVYEGKTYLFRAGDLLQVSGVPTSRQVIAGTGLTGGGQLSSNVTLSVAAGGIGTTQLADTGVTPGVYGDATSVPQLTIDATGRVTAATTVSVSVSGFVPTTRQVIAGNGLTGGGALNANVTLSASYGSGAPAALSNTGAAGSALTLSRSDHAHPAVDLADDMQVNGILGLDGGGTGRSLTMAAGAVMWSGADGVYVGPVGTYGQVLVSNGTAAPLWANLATDAPQPANYAWIGPASGADASPTYRALVNADIPATLASKTLTSVNITSGTITGITDLAVADGGTGASTAADARTNLGLGTISTQNSDAVSITGGSISGITDLAVADGGTGASTATDARTNLSVPSTTGTGASGSWAISVTGTAADVAAGSAGDLLYQSAVDTTTFLTLGTENYVLTAGATAPQYVAQSTLAVGKATNVAGGAASQIPYQTAADTTAFLANGTAGQVLTSQGASAPTWSGISGGTF